MQSFKSLLQRPNFKKENLGTVGELSKVCSQIVLKCLCVPCIGRPDIFCGPLTNLLDLSQNGQEIATDVKASFDFITLISQTITDDIVMWETRLSMVD